MFRDESGDAEARFRHLKGVIDAICEKVGLPALEWNRGGDPWLEDSAGAVLKTTDGKTIGMAGLVSKEVGARWDLGPEVAAAELDIDIASEAAVTRFEELARYPSIVMDMTVEHGEDLCYAELESAARDLVGPWVEDLSYVTQFKPESTPRVVRTTRRGLAEKLGVGFA